MWRRTMALTVVYLLATGLYCSAAEATREKIQAAYLYRFMEFVEFPGDTAAGSAKFCLCVMGDERLGEALASSVEGKSIAGRAVEVRSPSSAKEARACHLLFLTGRKPAVARQLQDLGPEPVLTVSDIPEAQQDGGVVTFSLKNNQMHFDINVENARKRRLLISSRLIQLSRSSQ